MFLLENLDTRIYTAHEKVSSYRQRGVQTKITKTVMDESGENKIRKIVDERCGFLNYAQRAHIINQVLEKRKEIISRFGPHFNISIGEIREACEKITAFYMAPEIKSGLEEIMKRKGSRYLLPSPNDVKLLAECCFIRNSENKKVILLTDDSHFTGFSSRIKKEFDIEIDSVV